jgi:hypothetical protein
VFAIPFPLGAQLRTAAAPPAASALRTPPLRRSGRRHDPSMRPRCRAATLPPIDNLAEACAPEGALYVDGVLFGGTGGR